MADQSMPPEAAPAPQQELGPISQLVNQIHDGLLELAKVATQFPPEIQDGFESLISNFEALVEQAMKGPQEPKQSGVAPMEAGAADVKPAL